jgi:hypothetical protein
VILEEKSCRAVVEKYRPAFLLPNHHTGYFEFYIILSHIKNIAPFMLNVK